MSLKFCFFKMFIVFKLCIVKVMFVLSDVGSECVICLCVSGELL